MTSWFHRELELGSEGPDVELIRRKLNSPNTGPYDVELEVRVRGLQRKHGLPVTGIVDAGTAEVLGEPARKGLVPSWFRRPLGPGCHGNDVEALSQMLGLEATTAYSEDLEAAVRRLQSELQMIPNGWVDEGVAVAIGDDVPLVTRHE